MNIYSVLSLFTGIGGMDMGFGGKVVVHKDSVAPDFVHNVKCASVTENFVELTQTIQRGFSKRHFGWCKNHL